MLCLLRAPCSALSLVACVVWRGIKKSLPRMITRLHVRVFLALLGALQVIHPTLNKHFLSDTAWTFSMYLESMAIVPQLFMFQKQAKGIVEVLVSYLKFRV